MRTVLLIDHAPFFGGAESCLVDLASSIDRREFTPIIISDTASPVLDEFRNTGDPVYATPLPRIRRTPAFAWRLASAGLRLARLAERLKADVMHTFTARTHLIGAVASRLSGIPLVWRIGDDTLPPSAMSFFGRVPRRIVGVSEWINAQYPRVAFKGIVPDGTRPAMDISRAVARRELGLAPEDRVAAHVGRLVRWKGQDVFIRAMANAVRAVPDARGIIVGSWHADDTPSGPLFGGERYYNELRALAVELGLNTSTDDRIMFTGFIRDPGMAYAAADVFAHTSILPEPFGRTIIEAMIAGCPVIASDAGGPSEILSDGASGLLTAPGDVDALSAALISVLQSPERQRALSDAGRARVNAEYTLDRMTRRMEAVYRAAL